jgi:hypothetical protein
MWLLSLWSNPLARKIVIGLAAGLAILYALRLYSNRIYSEGYQSGKIAGAAETLKTRQSEWKEKETAIAVDAKTVADEKMAVKAAGESLSRDRANLSHALQESLAAIQAKKEGIYANISHINASDLDTALRSVSADLAASQ